LTDFLAILENNFVVVILDGVVLNDRGVPIGLLLELIKDYNLGDLTTLLRVMLEILALPADVSLDDFLEKVEDVEALTFLADWMEANEDFRLVKEALVEAPDLMLNDIALASRDY
jgi:hypothetical protein